jgi:coenzyme F420-reducing hydrogenase alpha subunit
MKHPKSPAKIVIEPVTRVEGHGKVTILLDERTG